MLVFMAACTAKLDQQGAFGKQSRNMNRAFLPALEKSPSLGVRRYVSWKEVSAERIYRLAAELPSR
jgi:hypothetical protein